MGMLLVPMFVGRIFKKTITAEVGSEFFAQQEVTAAVNAEYIFIVLGMIAITVSILLARSAKRNPHLELDEPNKK